MPVLAFLVTYTFRKLQMGPGSACMRTMRYKYERRLTLENTINLLYSSVTWLPQVVEINTSNHTVALMHTEPGPVCYFRKKYG